MRFSIVLLWCALALAGLMAGAAVPAVPVPEAPPALLFGKSAVVAIRPLAELCGTRVSTEKSIITLTRGAHVFTFTLGKTAATQDGKAVTLPMAPFTNAGIGYVPVDACVTALGGKTKISDDMKTMQVTFDALVLDLPAEPQMGTPDTLMKNTLDIFLVTLDTGAVQQISYDVTNASMMQMRTVRFSRDGAAVLYEKGMDVYSRKLDSTAGTNLTAAFSKDGVVSAMPVAGPDGAVLCMQLNTKAAPGVPPLPDVVLITAKGEVKKLGVGARPQVSQDGKVIAYTAIDKDQKFTTHVMNADGTGDRVLGDGLMTALSPDGATAIILNPVFDDKKQLKEVVVNEVRVSDGKLQHEDDRLPAVMDGPAYAFSPDSKMLAFASPPAGITLMNLDRTGKKVQLTTRDEKDPTNVAGYETSPTFTPDGKSILFLRGRKLFAMPIAGGAPTPIAPNLLVADYSLSADGTHLLVVGVTDDALAAIQAQAKLMQARMKPPSSVPPGKYKPPTKAEIAAAQKAGTRVAVIKTVKGDITVELYGKDTPQTVANFVKLANAKFYNGLKFHRVDPGFVIQGGDPNGDGSGDPGYTIKREIAKNLKHVEGALAMARSDDPDSAGCQFYITLTKTPELDGAYAVFGKVIKGMDVVKKIAKGDKIISITVK